MNQGDKIFMSAYGMNYREENQFLKLSRYISYLASFLHNGIT